MQKTFYSHDRRVIATATRLSSGFEVVAYYSEDPSAEHIEFMSATFQSLEIAEAVANYAVTVTAWQMESEAFRNLWLE